MSIQGRIVLAACGCAWLIVTIALLAASWAVLTPQEWGLKYNKITITLDDDKVYSAGRIYVGVGGSFYKYPRKLGYVEFTSGNALDVWSADGQSVSIEASFYYRLYPENIHSIFYTYGGTHSSVIRAMAAETLRDVATQYSTLDFFTNRSVIDNAMTTALSDRIYLDGFANVTLFNLLDIDIPDAFDAAVATKVITGQDVITLEQLRQSQVIRSGISVINANAAANVTIINANAAATGAVLLQTKNAEVTQQLALSRSAMLSTLATTLNFTSPRNLLQYLYTDVIRGSGAPHVHEALDIASISVRV